MILSVQLECSLITNNLGGLPELSRLSQLVPTVGMFFTPLPLRDSFLIINKTRSIAGRRNVPPSFNDIRHLLNLSQVTAIAPTLNLITFDGDMTLYADGADFSRDSELVELIVRLLRNDINVAIVTAAGYPRDPTRYEQRLTGLLDGIRELNLTPLQKSRFFVLGGECNYLFRYDPETDHLKYIPEAEYQPDDVRRWSTSGTEISRMLDAGEACAEQSCEEMGIKDRVKIIRKERAVGIIGQGDKPLSREQLDEIALAIQRRLNNYQHARRERWIRRQPATLQRRLSRDHFQALRHSSHGIGGADVDVAVDDEEGDDAADFIPIPFCAFNGGSDVWLDIGNKLIGVKILQDVVKVKGDQTLHVGDQFLSTGNDILTRSCATTVWITSPSETAEVLQQLHDEIDKAGRAGKRTKT
ncbi:IMP-specific 5-nucleotidase [Zopfochytrium polystomum]|nr:IMP-specific 5-nucleotidase [Zopfochytrium polystomum]